MVYIVDFQFKICLLNWFKINIYSTKYKCVTCLNNYSHVIFSRIGKSIYTFFSISIKNNINIILNL